VCQPLNHVAGSGRELLDSRFDLGRTQQVDPKTTSQKLKPSGAASASTHAPGLIAERRSKKAYY
jgi:hypothetical protein